MHSMHSNPWHYLQGPENVLILPPLNASPIPLARLACGMPLSDQALSSVCVRKPAQLTVDWNVSPKALSLPPPGLSLYP